MPTHQVQQCYIPSIFVVCPICCIFAKTRRQIGCDYLSIQQEESSHHPINKRLLDAINQKIEGQELTQAPPEQPKAQIIDLMEALKASLGEPAADPQPTKKRAKKLRAVAPRSKKRPAAGARAAKASKRKPPQRSPRKRAAKKLRAVGSASKKRARSSKP